MRNFCYMLRVTLAQLITITFFFLGAFGCAQSYLYGPELGTAYTRLGALGSQPIIAALNVSSEPIVLGRQWVFLVFPAGIIRSQNPQQILAVSLFRKLAERGYRPQILSEPSAVKLGAPPTHFTITNFDIACSVPDLLVVRVVNCKVEIEGHLNTAPQISIASTGKSSEFRTFGFKPQLEQALAHALDDSVETFLTNLRL